MDKDFKYFGIQMNTELDHELKERYLKLPLYQLSNEFINACMDGDLPAVRYLLESPDLSHHANVNTKNGDALTWLCNQGHFELMKYLLEKMAERECLTQPLVNRALEYACDTGQLQMVKYLYETPELCSKGIPLPDISSNCHQAFQVAVAGGFMELVQYLLTAPKLPAHANLHAKEEEALMRACARGHLNIVQYLLDEKELDKFNLTPANISARRGEALVNACEGGHLEVVKYLVDYAQKHPENGAGLYGQLDYALKKCCFNKKWDVAHYLILELKMPISAEMEAFMALNRYSQGELLVKQRKFHDQLQDSLPQQEPAASKPKI